MDRAISLYKGGAIIHASDRSLNYLSYVNQGLRCLFCGEPVFLKSGYERRCHFSHFKHLSTRALEQCSLRQRLYSSGSNWRDLVGGKGQRLEVFQARFLSIVSRYILDYYILIKQIEEEMEAPILIRLTNEVYDYFRSHRNLLVQKCYDFSSKDSEDYPVNLQITFEALDYLMIISSAQIVKELIHNRLAVALEKESINLGDLFSDNNVKQVCFSIVEVLARTPWTESFRGLSQARRKPSDMMGRIDSEKTRGRDDRTKKLDVFLTQDLVEEFAKAILTPQYSSSSAFKLNPNCSAKNNHKESFLRMTSDYDVELCTVTSFGVVKSSKKICKYIGLKENKSDSLVWLPICKKYESLIPKLNEENSNIKIIHNPFFRQSSDLPEYLASWSNNEGFDESTIIAVANSSATQIKFKVEHYADYLEYFKKSEQHIVRFLKDKYELWEKNIWLEGSRLYVINILHDQVLPGSFDVDELNLTRIIQQLTEVDYSSLKNDYVKSLKDLIYLPPDLLRGFVKDVTGLELSLKSRLQKE